MTSIPATQARQRWAETMDEARREPMTITQHGRASVILLDAALATRALAALEDAEDAALADAAAQEIADGGDTVSLEQIANELGYSLG